MTDDILSNPTTAKGGGIGGHNGSAHKAATSTRRAEMQPALRGVPWTLVPSTYIRAKRNSEECKKLLGSCGPEPAYKQVKKEIEELLETSNLLCKQLQSRLSDKQLCNKQLCNSKQLCNRAEEYSNHRLGDNDKK